MSTAIATRGVDHLDTAMRDARKLIEGTDDLDTIREVVAQADGWRTLLRQVGESHDKQNACAQTKLRAIRRGGQLLLEMKEPNPDGGRKERFVTPVGLSSRQASVWRRVGYCPEDVFEEYLRDAPEPTLIGLLRVAPAAIRTGLAEATIEKAKDLRGDGLSWARIADTLGESPWVLRYWVEPTVREQAKRLGSEKWAEKSAKRRKQKVDRVAKPFREVGDPLAEMVPHLRKVAESLGEAVATADSRSEKARREALFPYVYALEDAIVMTMQGKFVHTPTTRKSA